MADNKRVGVIGAMDIEVATLKDRMEIDRVTEIASMSFCEGRLGSTPAVVVKCGMGKVNAGICAQILIGHFRVTHVINTGVAGSLDNRIDIGDFVISEDAVQHDYDVSPVGFRPGEIPYTGMVGFPADPLLRHMAARAVAAVVPEASVFEGRVCSGDQFIAQRAVKERITSAFGGLCAEMEGGAIAQVCYLNHIPFVILRTISDKADASYNIPFDTFAPAAAERCAAVTAHLLTVELAD